MNKYIPTGIKADRQRKILSISWKDQHDTEIPFGLLRNACPCAECRGGHENMRTDPDPGVFELPLIDTRTTEIRDIQTVGNYAINIEWADGHRFGIYHWDYLRALCACDECRPE